MKKYSAPSQNISFPFSPRPWPSFLFRYARKSNKSQGKRQVKTKDFAEMG
jgi:hypothetical protein